MFRAEDFDEALDKAEIEAVEYCEEDPEANFLIESLGHFSAYEILEEELESGVELMSERIETTLSTADYLEKYHPERAQG